MDIYIICTRKRCLLVITILFLLEFYFNVSMYKTVYDTVYYRRGYTDTSTSNIANETYYDDATSDLPKTKPTPPVYYKYPLMNSSEISMDYNVEFNSSYYWFMCTKHLFKNLGIEETPSYPKDVGLCQLNESFLEQIHVNKTQLELDWVEQQNPDVKLGGCYAPAQCRAKQRVAIFVTYRDRRRNLIIFLRYIHPLLKKQLLHYRIFVVEQYGRQKFNKGTLYNIAYLESQRFGSWDCLVFHDVDLIPENERISYSCHQDPTHMAAAVESFNYTIPYNGIFGGVTSLTPAQYEDVNGYSNFYWNWGGEDDDMHIRLVARNYNIARYDISIARYSTLHHPWNECGQQRRLFLLTTRLRYLKEGLLTTQYNLISVKKKKLYTHILAEVNPMKIKLGTKSLMQRIISLNGNFLFYDRQQLYLKGLSAQAVACQLKLEKLKNGSKLLKKICI